MKDTLSERVADHQVLADVQIDDSAMQQYGKNPVSALLFDLERFVTWEWWVAGHRMIQFSVDSQFHTSLSDSPYGWSFGSDGRLVCRINLKPSFNGAFVFMWSSSSPQPRLYYIESNDLDSVAVSSPRQNPPTKEAGAMVSIPEPDKRHVNVEPPQRISGILLDR